MTVHVNPAMSWKILFNRGIFMCIKGFVYRWSYESCLDIDRGVSTAYCRSSLGDNVELLSGTISTTVVVSDWCITNPACIRILSTPGLWFFTDVYLSFSKNSPSPEGDDG